MITETKPYFLKRNSKNNNTKKKKKKTEIKTAIHILLCNSLTISKLVQVNFFRKQVRIIAYEK